MQRDNLHEGGGGVLVMEGRWVTLPLPPYGFLSARSFPHLSPPPDHRYWWLIGVCGRFYSLKKLPWLLVPSSPIWLHTFLLKRFNKKNCVDNGKRKKSYAQNLINHRQRWSGGEKGERERACRGKTVGGKGEGDQASLFYESASPFPP